MGEIKTNTENWHSLQLNQVLEKLQTSSKQGLASEQAENRLLNFGTNTLPKGKEDSPLKILLRQFTSPLVYILVVAAVLTWWIGEYVDMTVILIVVAVNAAIGYYQEFRANRIFEKLQEIVRIEAYVIRDGATQTIDSENLVPGDLVILKGGSKVPADCRLLNAGGLEINESLLTGESEPVNKSIQTADPKALIGDRKNMAFMGTVVEQGNAQAIVVATGALTEIGKISALTQNTKAEATPLQKRVDKLGKLLTKIVVAISVIIFGVGVISGHSVNEMITTSIAVAVAAIPEGLPAAISVILAVSSQRILKRKGLVRRLLAAETLGSTSVICTDKTGTLTYGQMRVDKIITEDKEAALQAMALANEAILEEKDGAPLVHGEATDRAKLESFLAGGGNLKKLLSQMPRLALLPFNPEWKYIASFHQVEDKVKILVSGAPEQVLALCNLSMQKAKLAKSSYEELARGGYRVIAMAEKTTRLNLPSNASNDDLESQVEKLTYLGLAAIRDPIREDVKKTLAITRGAGIKVLMITGDHVLTARSIGRELGFSDHPGAIVTGQDLDEMSDMELKKRVGSFQIIARATPTHKMRVIDAWQSLGAVVAMTGDGVNDAPALKSANIGIAIGSGTDVTKEASDLVLLNDSFSTITAAVRQGRIGFENIKKVTILLLSNSFTEIVLILSSLVLAIPFPITAVQILWVNLVEDSLPVLALAFEPGEPGVMKKPPIRPDERIVDSEAKILIFAVGLITDVILVGIFLYLLKIALWPIDHIRTFIFTAVGIDTLLYVFAFKSLKRPIWRSKPFNNPFLLVAAAIGFTMLFAAVYLPILNKFLGTVPLGVTSILIIFAFGGLKVMLVEIVKWRYRVHA